MLPKVASRHAPPACAIAPLGSSAATLAFAQQQVVRNATVGIARHRRILRQVVGRARAPCLGRPRQSAA